MKVSRPIASFCVAALAVLFCVSPLLAAVTVTPSDIGDQKRWKITATGIINSTADSASFSVGNVPFLDKDNDVNLPTQLVAFTLGSGDTVQTQLWTHYVKADETAGVTRTIARTDTSTATGNRGTTAVSNLATAFEIVITNQKATIDTSGYTFYLLIPSDD